MYRPVAGSTEPPHVSPLPRVQLSPGPSGSVASGVYVYGVSSVPVVGGVVMMSGGWLGGVVVMVTWAVWVSHRSGEPPSQTWMDSVQGEGVLESGVNVYWPVAGSTEPPHVSPVPRVQFSPGPSGSVASGVYVYGVPTVPVAGGVVVMSGGWLGGGVTVQVTVAVAVSAGLPSSVMVYVNVSVPVKPAGGVYVTTPPDSVTVPPWALVPLTEVTVTVWVDVSEAGPPGESLAVSVPTGICRRDTALRGAGVVHRDREVVDGDGLRLRPAGVGGVADGDRHHAGRAGAGVERVRAGARVRGAAAGVGGVGGVRQRPGPVGIGRRWARRRTACPPRPPAEAWW